MNDDDKYSYPPWNSWLGLATVILALVLMGA